jgi:hypothetical protein
MTDYNGLVQRYMAIWNEPDPDARRAEIARLWAPDGAHFILDYRLEGFDAVNGRVGRAYTQWVEQAGNLFRCASGTVVGRGDVLKFSWEMTPADGGKVISEGFDFMTLDGSGRIVADHQFNEPPVPSDELNALADRYLAVWNEPDPDARRVALAELWAEGGSLRHDTGDAVGLADVEHAIARRYAEHAARGLKVRRTGDADGHRDVVRFAWERVPADGAAPAAADPSPGFEFLVLDDKKLIACAYQFAGTEAAAA